jgi:hypothetical protein
MTRAASLSSRIETNFGCLSRFSGLHSRNAIDATRCGLSHRQGQPRATLPPPKVEASISHAVPMFTCRFSIFQKPAFVGRTTLLGWRWRAVALDVHFWLGFPPEMGSRIAAHICDCRRGRALPPRGATVDLPNAQKAGDSRSFQSRPRVANRLDELKRFLETKPRGD